jgi:hypothetical protein
MVMNSQQQPQQPSSASIQYMPLSSKIINKSSPMPSASHQQPQPNSQSQQPQSNPPGSANSADLQQYKTDSKLYELLEKTRTSPEFNQPLGDEILENLYEFSLDCSFFAKQRSDGKYVLPNEHEIPSNIQRAHHPGMLKMPPNIPYSQPGPSSYLPQQQQQQQQQWASYSQQQPGSSMQRPQMAGPSGQQQQPITPSTPLPAHPPEFYRFNQQVPIRHVMQQQPGSSNPQMRSPFYPPSSMTPEQHQMYLQQQQQQKQMGSVGPAGMMSPAYSQVPTPQQQQQHGGQFSRQSSFKMNTPQPMIKQQENPMQHNNPSSIKQQQQHPGYIQSQAQAQQEPYFQSRPIQQMQRIDSNDNEMKPPLIPKQEIIDHQLQQQHRIPPMQQRVNGIMGPPSQQQHYQPPQTPNDLQSPKFQIKNELMSPLQGRPQSTTSLISNGIQQSPLQANGQPMSSSMGGQQTNVSPLVAITPPIGDGSPGCSSSLAAVLATKPGKSILAHAMDDQHRSTASPASVTSTASTSSRKRQAEEETNGAPKATVKRARCNPSNMPYRNMLEFIKKYLPAPQEHRMIQYICDLLLEPGKASKRVLEWKDEPRTFSIAKPRVFADRWKEGW